MYGWLNINWHPMWMLTCILPVLKFENYVSTPNTTRHHITLHIPWCGLHRCKAYFGFMQSSGCSLYVKKGGVELVQSCAKTWQSLVIASIAVKMGESVYRHFLNNPIPTIYMWLDIEGSIPLWSLPPILSPSPLHSP